MGACPRCADARSSVYVYIYKDCVQVMHRDEPNTPNSLCSDPVGAIRSNRCLLVGAFDRYNLLDAYTVLLDKGHISSIDELYVDKAEA
jgi:hypothetical protein